MAHGSCAHFLVEMMKNLAFMAGFNTIIMMITDSGLLFWATLYICTTAVGLLAITYAPFWWRQV